MKIEENKVVTLTYALRVTDEEGESTLVETADDENPMVFLFGVSGLPEKFEQELEGKNAGDSFKFTVASDDGYGDLDESAVVPVPKNVFEVDGAVDQEMVQVGNYIPMSDNEGNHMQGRIVSVEPDHVLMDFNHPLAGMDMHFEGKVISVREATEEEISHGHVHGEGGHQH